MVEVIIMTKDDILSNHRLELRKGTLVLAVLSELRTKHYGYSLVETLNKKGLTIDQNTLYPLLRRLDKHGLLDSIWDVEEPRPRKYYVLSDLGVELIEDLITEWKQNTKIIKGIVEG